MAFTHYGFKNCLGGFFEMSTANARRILPQHLQPIEAQHTRSVLAVMAFEFNASEVGAYDELVLSSTPKVPDFSQLAMSAGMSQSLPHWYVVNPKRIFGFDPAASAAGRGRGAAASG